MRKRFLSGLLTVVFSLCVMPLYTFAITAKEDSTELSSIVFSNKTENVGQRVIQASMGDYHSAAVTEDGSLYVWGDNSHGQLGDGTDTDRLTPVKIMDDVASVSLGFMHSAAITEDGSLYTWGYNEHGQLGDGTTEDRSTPVKIMDHVASVSLGDYHSAAITENGSLYMWGDNYFGKLGNGTVKDSYIPIKIMDDVVTVSLGADDNSAAVTQEGELYVWGKINYSAEPKLFDSSISNMPGKIFWNSGIKSACIGYTGVNCAGESLAILCEKDVFGIDIIDTLYLVDMKMWDTDYVARKIMNDVSIISLGWSHGAFVTNGDVLYMWGDNSDGQLGNGEIADSFSEAYPVLSNVASVSLGTFTSSAVTEDGTLYVWGDNSHGQLGNGKKGGEWNKFDENADSNIPIKVNIPNDSVENSTEPPSEGTYGLLSYKVLDDGTIEITSCDKSATEIVIPEKINGRIVTTIGTTAFSYCDSLSNVIIPDSITSIDEAAFRNCDGLTDVYYSGTIEQWNKISIAKDNDAIKNATIHYNCTMSERKTIAFGNCGNDANWTLDNMGRLTISGTGAIADWDDEIYSPWKSHQNEIKEVVIEEGITRIGNYSFIDLPNLTDVSLPDSLESIGQSAFLDTPILTEQTYAKTGTLIQYVGDWVVGCNLYSEIDEQYAEANYTTIKEGTIGIADNALAYKIQHSFSLPNSLKYIGKEAFNNNKDLWSITIPKNVVKIGENAFDDTHLKSVTFENRDTEINGNGDTIPNGVIIYLMDTFGEEGSVKSYCNKYNKKFLYYGDVLTKPFKPEKDGNSFLHNRYIGGGFYQHANYEISNKALADRLNKEKVKGSWLNKVYKAYRDNSYKDWSGTCHGIAASMAIEKNYDIFNDSYYDQGRPCENQDFLDIINFLHLTQYINLPNACYGYTGAEKKENSYLYNNYISQKDVLERIVKDTKDNPDKVYILNYGFKNNDGKQVCHSVVIQGCIQDDSGNYHIRLFDENTSGVTDLEISHEYSAFKFIYDVQGGIVNESNVNQLSIIDPDPLYNYLYPDNKPNPTNKDDVIICGDGTFNIMAAGVHLAMTLAGFEGDMKINNYQPIGADAVNGEAKSLISVDSNESYTINITSDKSDFMLYNPDKDWFYSFDGENISQVKIDTVENIITLMGEDMSFRVYVDTGNEINEYESGLSSVTGTISGTVTLSAENGEINVDADNPITGMIINSHVGNDVMHKRIIDTESLDFSVGNKGTIEVDSKYIKDLPGDVNCDWQVSVADVVLLQKWLLNVPDAKLSDWEAGDLCKDGRLDVFDLCLVKQQLINNLVYFK